MISPAPPPTPSYLLPGEVVVQIPPRSEFRLSLIDPFFFYDWLT